MGFPSDDPRAPPEGSRGTPGGAPRGTPPLGGACALPSVMLVSLVELFFISVVNSIRMNGNYPKRTYNELQSGCQRERGIYRERERETERERDTER